VPPAPFGLSGDAGDCEEFKVGRLAVTLTTERSDDVQFELECLGKYVNKWEAGAIDRFRAAAARWLEREGHTGGSYYGESLDERAAHLARQSRECRYFVPAENAGREYRMADYKLAEKLCAGDAYVLSVSASVSYRGIVLAEHTLTTGLIDGDSPGAERAAYVAETARDVLAEALSEARRALADIVADVARAGIDSVAGAAPPAQ